MLEFLLFLLIVVSISFFKAYKKTGSFSGAIEHLKIRNNSSRKDTQEEYSTFEDDEEEDEDSNATTVTRELTKDEIKHLSPNIRFLSSFFIAGSLINLSVNLDREIYIEMLDITIYTWYLSIFFLLFSTLTFFKPSTKKKYGKILLIEGTAEIYTKSNIVHLGEYTITLPKNWFVKDGKRVSIEGYESSPGNVMALSMGNYSVDGSDLRKRGKWIVLSIFLFINLFVAGIVYDGGRSFNNLLAVYNISSESLILDSYDSLVTKNFTKGQYIQIKNIDSAIVNNMEQSYRVLLPDSNGIDLDLSQIYHRLEKLKELQGTLMFNTLYYHDMEDRDFSFSNDFDSSDFTIFLDNKDFSNALEEWDAYLDSELSVDKLAAEAYLNRFIGSQIGIIKSQLVTAIDQAIYKNNYIKFYPMTKDNSFDMNSSQLYIKYFNEPFKPEYNLDGYYYIKEIEDKFKQSDKFSISFFFRGYIDGEQSTNLKVDVVKTDRELLYIYFRAGIFTLSLLLYLLVLYASLRIKKLNNKSRSF